MTEFKKGVLGIPPRDQFFPSKYKQFYDMEVGASILIEIVPYNASRVISALHKSKICKTEGRRYATRRASTVEPYTSYFTRLA